LTLSKSNPRWWGSNSFSEAMGTPRAREKEDPKTHPCVNQIRKDGPPVGPPRKAAPTRARTRKRGARDLGLPSRWGQVPARRGGAEGERKLCPPRGLFMI